MEKEKQRKDQSNFGRGTHLALFRGSLSFGLGTRLSLFDSAREFLSEYQGLACACLAKALAGL